MNQILKTLDQVDLNATKALRHLSGQDKPLTELYLYKVIEDMDLFRTNTYLECLWLLDNEGIQKEYERYCGNDLDEMLENLTTKELFEKIADAYSEHNTNIYKRI